MGHVNTVTSFVTPMWKAWRETLRNAMRGLESTPCWIAANRSQVRR